MRLSLVDNLIFPEPGDVENLDVHPHLGLLSLAAVLNGAGHEATLFDPKWPLRNGILRYDDSLYQRAADLILAQDPRVVGFTSMGCSFLFTLKTAAYLRKRAPRLPILLGGPHASILHREILERFDQFDAVVRHEAENTILPVLEGLEAGDLSGIPGVTWKNGGDVVCNPGSPTIEDLDALPLPAYDSVRLAELGLSSIRVDAGRGCPFHCTFCSTATFFGRRYRLKSAERLVREMDYLNQYYGFTDFKLNHDLFTVNKRKVHAFCEAVKDRGYTWGVSARVDCVDELLLGAMSEAGCTGIYFGIETGSRRLQKLVKKNLDLDLVDPCFDITEDLGMQTVCSFITGYPQETEADRDDTLDMLGRCLRRDRELFVTQLHMLTPEPGTQIYENYAEEMAASRDASRTSCTASKAGTAEAPSNLQYDGYLTDFNGELLELDDEQVIVANPDIFVTHFYLPTLEPRHDHVLTVDAYRVLRRAGHTILTYVMRFYDGRFSRLVCALREYVKGSGGGATLDTQLVLRFFADTFGPEHHVTSLMRYALITEHARKVDASGRGGAPSVSLDEPYELHSGVYLFSALHDCAKLIERIQRDIHEPNPFEEVDSGRTGFYLVIARGGKEGAMENFEIDRLTYMVLTEFVEPRTIREVADAVERASGGAPFEDGVLRELVRLGALTPPAVVAASGAVLH